MSRLNLLRASLLVLALMLLAVLAPTAMAGPLADTTAWSGEYYNNVDLSGPPVLLRADPDINFFWPEYTSPAPGFVNVDNYSVRWTRSIYFGVTGNWTFTTVNDDGMRVWVDDMITMDAWYDQGPTTHTGTIYLTAGWHVVKVEYYNRTLGGTARVSWAPQGAFPQWMGEYFNNMSLAGSPVVIRNDASVNFNWGYGSPDPVVPVDHFSARWTRTLYLDAGTYRATVTSDDGVRVWVDGALQIDQWHDQPPTTYTRDIALGAGNHILKIEYFEDAVVASISFSFDKVSPGVGIWHGQYYNNMFLSGSPVLVRDDAALNFDWGTGSPDPVVPVDNWSAKWDATISLPSSGNYDVSFTSDDGVRVWIDGVLVIDGWWDHPATTFTVTRYYNAGNHSVHVEYYEHAVFAVLKGQIVPSGAPPPPPPGDIIVDDRGAGWQAGGCPTCWRGVAAGYGGHAFWTWNNYSAQPGYNWARWFPNLPYAGYYEVFAYIPAGIGNTTAARYWTYHNATYNLRIVNQGYYGNQWVSLGTYYFADNGTENVSLTDVTYEAYLSHTIVFDAMKFSPR